LADEVAALVYQVTGIPTVTKMVEMLQPSVFNLNSWVLLFDVHLSK